MYGKLHQGFYVLKQFKVYQEQKSIYNIPPQMKYMEITSKIIEVMFSFLAKKDLWISSKWMPF